MCVRFAASMRACRVRRQVVCVTAREVYPFFSQSDLLSACLSLGLDSGFAISSS